jgi:hypothetical protein
MQNKLRFIIISEITLASYKIIAKNNSISNKSCIFAPSTNRFEDEQDKTLDAFDRWPLAGIVQC